MPAVLSRTSSKRKVDDDETDVEEGSSQVVSESQSSTKRLKKDETAIIDNGQPKNKVLPTNIVFPPKAKHTIRMSAWNICGFAASQKKGFKHYVQAEDPDILVLTETKVNDVPMDLALNARYPHRYWSISSKKTYAGIAILSKYEALSMTQTLPGHPDPASVKGRIITLEFETCYVIGTYVVNAGVNLQTLDQKKIWNTHFDAYIRELDQTKPVIWTGDLNVAPTEMDLANPKKNWNKTAGYTEPETTAFKNILRSSTNLGANKFIDVWRDLHPDTRHYTYFSYRFNCRMKGLGWRIDMFVTSERLKDRIKMCEIRDEIWGASDHCPLVMEIEGPL